MKIRRPQTEKKQRRWGDRQEAKLSSKVGYGKTVSSGSGAEKGDLRRGNWMIEVKSTRADSFRVSADIMGKLRNDGLTNGRPGVLIVQLGDGRQYVVMPLIEFEDLTEDANHD